MLAGVRVQSLRGTTHWHAVLSHLRDPLVTRARLDALSIGAEGAVPGFTTARGEVALRQWETGAGVGATAEFGQRSDAGDWRLRATHAPGGSRAFARAETDVTLTGARLIGGTRLGYVGFYAADDGFAGVAQRTQGFGLLPQWQLGQSATLGLEARVGSTSSGGGFREDAAGSGGRLATSTNTLGSFASARLGGLTASSSATWMRTTRDVGFGESEDDVLRLDEDQLQWSLQLLRPFAFGTVDVFSSLQRRLGASSLSAGQYDMVVRMEQLALPWLEGRVRMGAALGRTVSLGTGVAATTQRVGFSTTLPFNTWLRLDLERNPWLTRNGNSGWSTALRVERSFGAPGFLRGGRGTGVVFEDRNGDGLRGPDERGLAGVLVQVGGEVVVTDNAGQYRLTRSGGGIPTLDERSLPFGLMLAPRLSRGVMAGAPEGAFDIAVVPVGVVEVQLELVADSLVGRGALSLAGVRVSALDDAGRRFFAQLLPDGRARFEALPPGTYRIEVDGSAARESLSLQGPPPTVRLDGKQAQQTLRLLLGPRRVRMFLAPPATGTSSGASSGTSSGSSESAAPTGPGAAR